MTKQLAARHETLMDVREAAAFLGISPKTMWAWKAQRRIPSYQLGSAIRIKRSDLEAFLEAGYTPALEQQVAR